MSHVQRLESRRLLATSFEVEPFVIVQSTDGTVFEVTQSEVPSLSKTGTLLIRGRAIDDVIFVKRHGDTINVSLDAYAHPLLFSYPAEKVRRIQVDARDGNDRVGISINMNRRCTLAGGAGRDILVGSPGDTLVGGGGSDKLVAQQIVPSVDVNGNVVLRAAAEGWAVLTGGAGNDTLVGGGNDTVVGGAGEDRAIYEHFVAPGEVPAVLAFQLWGDGQQSIEEFFAVTREANNTAPFLPV